MNIQNKKLADFLKIEQTLGSERLENKSRYISKTGLAHPIQFRRKQIGIPDLIIQYFYFEKDSTIDNIEYEWDETNIKGYQENATISYAEIAAFIIKYQELYSQIFNRYGKSKSEGNLEDTSKISTGNFEKTDTWNTADSTVIELYTILSNKYVKKGAMTITPTYRIRLNVQNLAENETKDDVLKPSENKFKELDSVFSSFLADLKNKNIEKAKLYLSASIISTETDNQLESLRKNIRFSDVLIVFFTGVQIGLDGSNYLLLQYKYKKDSVMPPKDLIKVVFDKENKIVGIQPIKRQ
jgi:hypothetical protein